ncbi:MAG: hypothetical protein WBA98_03655 [Gordonia sp. (in: high G+C Gram-positive bacteria)]|uniref:hypothetical protein n=1 Tax=Gordonia sp. (in: high G+C Gram-positive bacteria) TaxID=84139 RepID=UPI003C70E910
MANINEDAYLTQGAAAIGALGKTIALYLSTGARVGTVSADTTWGTPVLSGSGAARVATLPGSEAMVSVPAGVLSAGAVITHYGIMSGSTLLRRVDLEPVSLTVNRGDIAFEVRVTPTLVFDPSE